MLKVYPVNERMDLLIQEDLEDLISSVYLLGERTDLAGVNESVIISKQVKEFFNRRRNYYTSR